MKIIYSNKAKDDLARIDWRTRSKIISTLGVVTQDKIRAKLPLKRLDGSNLVKTTLEKHVIIGESSDKALNVLSILRQQKLKPSGVKFVQA